MIIPVRYGGHTEAEKDGKKVKVPIHSAQILYQFGAFIDVTFSHPKAVQEQLRKLGKNAPSISVKAIIDTGANCTLATPKVINEVGLLQTGTQKVFSIQNEQDQPTYYGLITFSWGASKEIPITSCPFAFNNYDCVIGRDILMYWYFTYNGPDGSIVICD